MLSRFGFPAGLDEHSFELDVAVLTMLQTHRRDLLVPESPHMGIFLVERSAQRLSAMACLRNTDGSPALAMDWHDP